MAKIEEVRLVDDLDGTPGDETVTFALDGQQREIDLTSANAARLRDALAPYLAVARRVTATTSRRSSTSSSSSRSSSADKARNAAVREWGRRNGHEVSERGRLGREVLDAHRDAGHPATSGSADGAPSPAYLTEAA